MLVVKMAPVSRFTRDHVTAPRSADEYASGVVTSKWAKLEQS